MDTNTIYNTILGLVIAAFWHWVRGIDKKQDEDKARMDRIDERMSKEFAEVRKDYQRRDDAQQQSGLIIEMLKDIKNQVEKLGDKLDKKADKS